MKSLFIAAALLMLAVSPANAAPLGMAITLLLGGSVPTLVGSFALTGFWGSLAKVAFSTLLSKALQRKPNTTVSGISRETTTSGGVTPQSFVMGWYATAGHAVCPNLSHGVNNRYQTYVIDLGDIPIATLHQAKINNDLVDFSGTVHAGYGIEAVGKYAGRAWIKFHDGTQTVADPMMLDKYGTHPEYPWSADMVGTGVPYAILTFDYDRELYGGYPSMRYVVNGIKLYDPRMDTTVGGAGAQRWADPATWAFSVNPVVMIYNIKRNIELADGSVWGLSVDGDDLDVSEWAAAMNVCDEAIPLAAGGTEPRYRAGLEINLDQEPLAVIEELLKGCSGEVAEVGGQWHIHVGDPALPIYFMTDDDLIRTKDSTYEPFPSLEGTYNAITASHPLPENNWEVHDAAPIYNSEWEAADGDRRLTAHLELGGVPFKNQVQRLMQEYINDERRMRRHTFSLPPDALICRPLTTISWTSAHNQYNNKLFVVGQQDVDTASLCSQLAVRERDPSDYNWLPSDERPDVVGVRPVVSPPAIQVAGFGVIATTIQDDTGTDRRPAIKISWATGQLTFQGVEWEVRAKANGAFITSGSTGSVARGFVNVTEGILPGVEYEIRVSPISTSPTLWSGWQTITTDDVRISVADLDTNITQSIIDAQVAADAAAADAVQALNDALTVASNLGLLDTTVNGLLASTAITEATLTTVEGIVMAGVGLAAVTETVDGVVRVASLRLTSSSDPDGSGGTAILMNAENVIVDGTLSTEKLVVGLGRQMLKNSEWSNGLQGWTGSKGPAGSHNGEITVGLRPAGSTYAGVRYETYMLQQLGVSTDSSGADLYYHSEIVEGNIVYGEPVGENQWVEASVNVSSLNCSCQLYLRWIDADTLTTGWTLVASSGPTDLSPDNPEDWLRLWGKAQAPAGTAYVGWLLRKNPTSSGGSSWLFAHKPQLALTHEHSTTPIPWSTGGTTLLTGAGIYTGTLNADHVNVASFAAAGLAVFGGAVQSIDASYNATTGVITGWKFDANPANQSWISGDLIADGVITRRAYTQKWASLTITTGYIQIGAVMPLELQTYIDHPTQTQNYSNPLAITISGTVVPLDNLAGRMSIITQGRHPDVNSNVWETLNLSVNTAFYYRAGSLNEPEHFSMKMMETSGGTTSHHYNEFRVLFHMKGAGDRPSTSCSINSVVIEFEQLNR